LKAPPGSRQTTTTSEDEKDHIRKVSPPRKGKALTIPKRGKSKVTKGVLHLGDRVGGGKRCVEVPFPGGKSGGCRLMPRARKLGKRENFRKGSHNLL